MLTLLIAYWLVRVYIIRDIFPITNFALGFSELLYSVKGETNVGRSNIKSKSGRGLQPFVFALLLGVNHLRQPLSVPVVLVFGLRLGIAMSRAT